MKQKDLITYGLIGLAVYFLFMKKENTEVTENTTGAKSGGVNNDTPELATNDDKTSTEGNNTEDYTNDRENFPNSANK